MKSTKMEGEFKNDDGPSGSRRRHKVPTLSSALLPATEKNRGIKPTEKESNSELESRVRRGHKLVTSSSAHSPVTGKDKVIKPMKPMAIEKGKVVTLSSPHLRRHKLQSLPSPLPPVTKVRRRLCKATEDFTLSNAFPPAIEKVTLSSALPPATEKDKVIKPRMYKAIENNKVVTSSSALPPATEKDRVIKPRKSKWEWKHVDPPEFPLSHDEVELSIQVPQEVLESAVDTAILQVSTYLKVEGTRIIAISGKGANKVVGALKDSVLIRETFDLVIFVTVLEDWTILEIQDDIARQVSLMINGLTGTSTLDTILRKEVILLVNGLHERIEPLTITKGNPNFKVVFATRSWRDTMSWTMSVGVKIKMEDHLVPWFLFCREVGQTIHISPTIRFIAASLIRICSAHLPAIILLSRALRGIAEIDVWETALDSMLSPAADNSDIVMNNALKFVLARKGYAARKFLKYLVEKKCISWRLPTLPNSLVISFPLKLDNELVITNEEGPIIVNDLIDAVLLERESLIIVNALDAHLLERDELNLNINEEILRGLLNTSLWEFCELLMDRESNAKKIQLNKSGVSELPERPNCPMLESLSLQNNNDLIVIPSLFFQHMKTLKVLDLSYTSISSLPESFFLLSSLTKFFLRGCKLFMELPSQIRELKNLEELDLEGSDILHLPETVRYLTKLTYLRVSFYGEMHCSEECNPSDTMIPEGVLSELSKMVELSIEVNPADKRWDEAVKVVVKELTHLQQLKSLKMHLPEVELLDELRTSVPSLTNFRLTLGRHQRRIMSRIPPGVEGKFEIWSKCLKYANGNESNANTVSAEVKIALKYIDSFFLNRHFTLTEISAFGVENMQNLRSLVVGECDQLQTIINGEAHDSETDDNFMQEGGPALPLMEHLTIYRMKNLKSIWKGPTGRDHLRQLRSLTLNGCPQMRVIFTLGLVNALPRLKDLTVEDCPEISTIISWNTRSENEVPNLKTRYFMEVLTTISLHHLPKLESISSGLCMAQNLERMSIFDCPKLRSLSTKEVSSKRLRVIIGENQWWDALQWEDESEWKGKRPPFVPIREGSHFKTQLATDGFSFTPSQVLGNDECASCGMG